jgi:signal peptidase I
VLLVAIAVAVGIHTFFLKPFKIPTGSMQPTLYGITHENFIDRPEVQFPNVVQRFFTFWYRGLSHTHVVARDTGQLRIIDEQPLRLLLFNVRQRFQIGSVLHTIWFPPDDLFKRAGLIGFDGRPIPKVFARGEDVIKLKVVSGDYLFVDRLSYNFRRPKRGEIIVFETKGINHPQISGATFTSNGWSQLGSEQVRIGNDRPPGNQRNAPGRKHSAF